jgi:hypothetical protein
LHEELWENSASEAVEEVKEVVHSVEEKSVNASIQTFVTQGASFAKSYSTNIRLYLHLFCHKRIV